MIENPTAIAKLPEKSRSLPTLPRSLAVLVDDDFKSPLDWAGDWYQADGEWRFMARWCGPEYEFSPQAVPEAVQALARDKLAVLERSLALPSMEEIERGLAEVALVTGSKASDGEEVWKARYTIYARMLEDIPRDILRHALDQHVRTNVFFPKISELRGIADPILRKRKFYIARLRKFLDMEPSRQTIFELAANALRTGA